MLSCTSLNSGYATGTTKDPLAKIGYWISFVGTEAWFYPDRRVILSHGATQIDSSRLNHHEFQIFNKLLQAEERDELRSSGYVPGCCDAVEGVFLIDDVAFGYRVCTGQKSIDVSYVIDTVNSILRKHFKGSFIIPTENCQDWD